MYKKALNQTSRSSRNLGVKAGVTSLRQTCSAACARTRGRSACIRFALHKHTSKAESLDDLRRRLQLLAFLARCSGLGLSRPSDVHRMTPSRKAVTACSSTATSALDEGYTPSRIFDRGSRVVLPDVVLEQLFTVRMVSGVWPTEHAMKPQDRGVPIRRSGGIRASGFQP